LPEPETLGCGGGCGVFLDYQKDSALAKWFEARTENARKSRKKMIVALARKLLIALWHFVHDGVVHEGVVLRPAH